jgi:prophage regulatory protein
MHEDILGRLRLDPGQRTIGQLTHAREAALHEIVRLRAYIERLHEAHAPQTARTDAAEEHNVRPGMLLRLTQSRDLLGVSRSTIYQWIAAGTFPPPVRVGDRAVRWRIEDVETWRCSLVASLIRQYALDRADGELQV